MNVPFSKLAGWCLVALLLGIVQTQALHAEDGVTQVPLAAPSAGSSDTLFESLPPDQTGVDYTFPIDLEHPLQRLYSFSNGCGSVAIGDVNGDGKPDLFFAGSATDHALYLQTGDFQFTDVTAESGVSSPDVWAAGSSLVDIDGDGDLDIYAVCYDTPNQLFINETGADGKVRFVERAKEYGLDLKDGCTGPAFCDYDRDGDLDVYIYTYHLEPEHGRPEGTMKITITPSGEAFVPDEWKRYYRAYIRADGSVYFTEHGRPDYLYRNNGDGTFTDVSAEAGIPKDGGYGISATWWDYNHDGWPDLYIGNDFSSPDRLYQNNGDGTFDEVSESHFSHTAWFSMGAAVGDFNNDLMTDFIVGDMKGTTHYKQKVSMGEMGARFESMFRAGGVRQVMHNTVFVNTGTPRFLEVSQMAHLSGTDWTWAIKAADFDLDRRTDLFFANGMARNTNWSDAPAVRGDDLIGHTWWDYYKVLPEKRDANLAFKNEGGLDFHNVSDEWGLHRETMSYCANTGDLDGDGDLDLVVCNLEDPVSIYRNNAQTGNRLVLELKGRNANTAGIGAEVELQSASGSQIRQFWNTGGYMSADEPVVHFGLGDDEVVEKLIVRWPEGPEQVLTQLAANHRYIIEEPETGADVEATPLTRTPPGSRKPLFSAVDIFDGAGHVEQPFDDFARQPLLPNQHSQLGPGQAWADLDGDGMEEMYLGGSTGVLGRILSRSRKFSELPQPFAKDAGYEDMAPLFFDADEDRDLDLYVVSGSVECDPGDPVLQDRLYLNNGAGVFERAPADALPEFRDSGSAVVAADFDKDGDQDLFVGGRVVPGEYPTPPRSHLLINDGGKFTDQTEALAPALSNCGMVTSALWTDVDNDGWLDLLVAHEWGPVRVMKNREGKLEDISAEAGTANLLGWWNGLTGRDIDNDGDIDYAVTSFGLNTKYHADEHHPEMLYYGDFDDSGHADIVEAKLGSNDVCLPRRGYSCSSRAMPFLVKKVGSYENFALSTLSDLYSDDKLNNATLLKANEIRSGYLLNDGEGHLTFHAMPLLAQVSPGFGVVLTDYNYDGLTDCYLAQNFKTPQIETTPMDGGLSVLLRGTGNAEEPFEAVWPNESGLIVPGDGMSLATTDLNNDQRVDFVMGVNNGNPKVFVNQTANSGYQPLKVALPYIGKDPVGARVTVKCPGMPDQTAEVYCGGGYLSQSAPVLYFGLKKNPGDLVKVIIRWPDGEVTEQSLAPPM